MHVLNLVSLFLLRRCWFGKCQVPDNKLQEKNIPIFAIFADLYHRVGIILLFSILEVYSYDGISIQSCTTVPTGMILMFLLWIKVSHIAIRTLHFHVSYVI